MTAAAEPATLLFDGRCGFCTGTVRWLQRRFRVPVLVVPWQEADLDRLGVSTAEAERAVQWVEPDGRHWSGHRAAARALQSCRRPWPWLGRLVGARLATPLAAPGYHLISRLRGYLPGTTPACDEPGRCQPRAATPARDRDPVT